MAARLPTAAIGTTVNPAVTTSRTVIIQAADDTIDVVNSFSQKTDLRLVLFNHFLQGSYTFAAQGEQAGGDHQRGADDEMQSDRVTKQDNSIEQSPHEHRVLRRCDQGGGSSAHSGQDYEITRSHDQARQCC
jgi:hypothetical protein